MNNILKTLSLVIIITVIGQNTQAQDYCKGDPTAKRPANVDLRSSVFFLKKVKTSSEINIPKYKPDCTKKCQFQFFLLGLHYCPGPNDIEVSVTGRATKQVPKKNGTFEVTYEVYCSCPYLKK